MMQPLNGLAGPRALQILKLVGSRYDVAARLQRLNDAEVASLAVLQFIHQHYGITNLQPAGHRWFRSYQCRNAANVLEIGRAVEVNLGVNLSRCRPPAAHNAPGETINRARYEPALQSCDLREPVMHSPA
jgi:hypothetical protein